MAFVEAVRTGEFMFQVRPETRPSLMYVKDLLRGFIGLMSAPAERLTRRVYNVQAFSPTAREIADAILARLPGCRITFRPDPVIADLIESWPSECDDSAARRDWDWRPHYDLGTMADDFIQQLSR
jgi:threonine 3-dehydrogenase